MSDRYTITPYKQAMENYKKDYSEQMQYGDPTVEVENYIFEQEYEFEDENHQALQERLANGEIRIARSAEDAKNGNWVDINSEYWGDKEGLRYETREDGAIIIYEGDTPLGWTYPSEDNNFYGIMTQTSDGFLVSNYTDSSGVTYYRQKNGFYISIDGKIYRNAFGSYTTPIFTNLGHIEVDGITYYEQPNGGGYVNEYGFAYGDVTPVEVVNGTLQDSEGKTYQFANPDTVGYITDSQGNEYQQYYLHNNIYIKVGELLVRDTPKNRETLGIVTGME